MVIEQLKQPLKGKENLIKFILLLSCLLGIYLLVAWASYSPLDNSWSTASSLTEKTLNKTGHFGAWAIDLFYAMFGKASILIPFSLIISSLYMLRMKPGQIKWKRFLIKLASFFLLLIGLSGLSSVLFSNTAYYLSGGFIGGIWQAMLADSLGQFVALLMAMVCAVIGLYFCSVHALLPIVTQFYHWMMAKTEDPKLADSTVYSQNLAENQPLEKENFTETEEIIEQTLFTDISAFKRPNISGLRQPDSIKETNELHHKEIYKTEDNLNLPKINIPQQLGPEMLEVDNDVTLSAYQDSGQPRAINNVELPKVRLNSEIQTETVAIRTPNNQNEIVENIISVTPVSHENGQDDESYLEKTVDTHQDILPDFVVTPAKTVDDMTKEVVYPKGYGDTLIHPLLQRHVTTEKPTTPLPTLDLLNISPAQVQQITEQEIRETSMRLESELANFGVKATVEDVLVGPVVTRYEIQPAAGVKASKITNLASDIARGLMFKAIRITEVIPNKPYMGIETPNKHRETVWLRDVLDSDAFRNTTAKLPMALGKDISGSPIVVDMAKMPHLLVAGQTGGGKSVGVNTMILSLLFKLTPEQVRFIMIDPKVVELSIYNDIPHLLTPVVTDMKKAANALRWAVEEMERRYLLVSHLQVRNIEGYNAKIDQATDMNLPIPDPTWRPGDSMDKLPPPLQKLSYIVLIVDEFADLMMSAGKEIEEYIMRIAQKARAVGIHLILATQRPSTDVITGVIKANIPSRIAFTVASQIDSRTILDAGGAEALLGQGDMLYSGAGSPDIIRVHGAFMSDEEVQRVADNWRARGKPNYLESIVESRTEGGDTKNDGETNDLDPLFDEVVAYIIETGSVSISNIQRKFSLGFNRAGRIVDQMEAQGIISEPGKGGKREVLAR